MKRRLLIFLLLITISLVGCNKTRPEGATPAGATVTPGLATPVIQTTQAPDVELTAEEFLDGWKNADYTSMYALLSQESQGEIREEDFSQLYWSVAVELAMESLNYSILSSYIDPVKAQVAVTIDYNSRILSNLTRDIILTLTMEGGEWKIDWTRGLIFPELEGENQLQLTRLVPSRGNIYDRNGSVIVAYSEAVSVGLTPSQIKSKKEDKLLEELGRSLDRSRTTKILG